MYRLNCNISDEAAQILKNWAERFHSGMGTVITIWALQKEDACLNVPCDSDLSDKKE